MGAVWCDSQPARPLWPGRRARYTITRKRSTREQEHEQQQTYAAQQQQYAPPPNDVPAPAPPAGDDLTAQLQQLSQLHNAGVLSDAEFAAAKQKLLG